MGQGAMTSVVVAGAGVAGALCTMLATEAGLDVTVVDADLPRSERVGVPHKEQLHNVLTRGQSALGEVDPDAANRMVGLGLVRADVADATRVFELQALMPRRNVGREIWSISRGAFEEALHSRTPSPARLMKGHVQGPVIEGSTVVGVRVLDQYGAEETLRADLVIDCLGGRGALASSLGVPGERLTMRQWYASADVELAEHDPATREFCLTFPFGDGTRGGLMSPAGSARVKVSLNGVHVDPTPRTVPEFIEFAASLDDHTVVEALTRARYISPPRVFQKPTAQWWRYDRLPGYDGLVAVGDSSASLNPLFGQGLSGATWEAAQLARAFSAQGTARDVTRDYRRRSATLREAMWRLMTIFSPESTVRLDDDQAQKLVRRVVEDPLIHRDYVDVWHLMAPVDCLTDLAEGRRCDWDRLPNENKDVWL